VYGLRPVQELVERRLRDVERIFVAREKRAGLGRILRVAREAGVPVTHLPRMLLSRKVGPGAAHQGIAAQVAALPYADPEQVCRDAREKPDGLLLLLDRVVDPGNLGAIVRSAAAAGADGILLGVGGTVGLSPAVAKASAGALERIPVAREGRPARRIERLRAEGFAALVLDPRAELSWHRAPLGGRILLVVGGEARGPSPAVIRACDERVAIPLARGVESLNVAVAASVLLFELVRQRKGGADGLETAETR
jgi:23S rRNA (guanosine2251-2'-O)-methyltransferase